jgi:hypothetical protein
MLEIHSTKKMDLDKLDLDMGLNDNKSMKIDYDD